MPAVGTAAFALVVIAFVAVSRRTGRLHLTAPIVFTAIGYLASRAVDTPVDASLIRSIAEATLAVVLFHDAAQVRPAQLRGDAGLCLRLLLVGLPLTILLGLGAAQLLLPGLGFALLLLLASALAPTDAGLGAATVLNPVVPVRVRRILNVESGLNDGLSTPVVLFAIAIALVPAGQEERVVLAAIRELAIGTAVGVGLGALAGFVLARAVDRGWAERTLNPVATLAVPLLTYYGSVALSGNGFVAAFVSGTAFAWALDRTRTSPDAPDVEESLQLAEWTSLGLGYLVWALFGYVSLGALTSVLTWQAVVFALLSLTVLRMLPVAVALLGTGFQRPSVLFVGWFGPRGLASVVFSVIAVESLPMTPELQLVLATIVLTVLLSVVLHGVSADPWAARYGAWAQRTHPPAESEGSLEPGRGRSGMAPAR
ncbi:MAG: cation:proton antiporter [Candidatus Nanopelagicales bacterium]